MSSNLPASMSRPLGREDELAQIRALLDRDDTRLLTLTGPGGIGKTRIALEVADQLHGDFAHGVCFVPLASIRDPDLVPSVVAQSLGVWESGARAIADTLRSVLGEQHLLLVLDNMEQVIASASWLGGLLVACPRVKALVTSRVPLHVRGEQRFLVPPLATPESDRRISAETLSEHPAVELFVKRARAVQPAFVLDETTAGVVAEICRRLDGVPLAIELAAARINVLSPGAILARLTDRLTLLTGSMRDAPERHRTMRDAIAWSYDLLTPDEQQLFRRLSVFVGGFTLDAAEAVAADSANRTDRSEHSSTASTLEQGHTVVDLVASLVDKSLIVRSERTDGELRFWMLETIREFGLDRLVAYGEADMTHDAHATWFLGVARESELGMEGPDQLVWLDRLEREHDNIRRALAWLVERERIEEALDLAGSIRFFLWLRGYYDEGRQMYAELLAHPRGAHRTVARARALNAQGSIALSHGDISQSLTSHAEAISIFREHHDRSNLSLALTSMGAALQVSSRLDEAELVCTESLALAREQRHAVNTASALCMLAILAMSRGDRDRAWTQMQEGADLCRAVGNGWCLSVCLGNLGEFAMSSGDAAQAERNWQESLALVRELGDMRDLPFVLLSLAGVARHRGNGALAERHLTEALTVARAGSRVQEIGFALVELGRLATASGDISRARACLRDGISAISRLGSEPELARCLDAFADMAVVAGEMGRAASFIGAADAAHDRAGAVRIEVFPGQHRSRIDTVQSTLGEDGYHQAWSEGQKLTREAAIAEALAYEPSKELASRPGRAPQASGPASDLTARELEVLKLMADGLTNQEIADALSVSHRTATSHASSILGKLGLTSRTAAVAYAIREGLA